MTEHILHLELQEGWAADPVRVSVNGETIYEGCPMTRVQIGLADTVVAETDTDAATVRVELTASSDSVERIVQLAREHWIGVTLERTGEITLKEQSAPFGYV